MYLYLLLVCIPAAMGQLILGPCPEPPPHETYLNLKEYSGHWHVIAQNRLHPLRAGDCQKVTYSETNERLSANFTLVDYNTHRKTQKHAVITRKTNEPSGNLNLRFDDIPRTYQFRVLRTNYSTVAVEYLCLSGVFNYTTSVTVLHRAAPQNLGDMDRELDQLNIPPYLRKDLKPINHANC